VFLVHLLLSVDKEIFFFIESRAESG